MWVVVIYDTGNSEVFGPFRRKERAEAVYTWLTGICAEETEVSIEPLVRPSKDRLNAWLDLEAQ